MKESVRPHGPSVDAACCCPEGLQGSWCLGCSLPGRLCMPPRAATVSSSSAGPVRCALLCPCLPGAGDPEGTGTASQPQEPVSGGWQGWASQAWAEVRDEPGGKVPSEERLGRNPLSPEGEGFGLRQPQRQRSSFIDPESLFLRHKITENWVKKGQSLDELSLQFSISGQVLGLIFPLSLPSFFFFSCFWGTGD